MPNYTADPLNPNTPLDTDFVGLATPLELRAIKNRVNQLEESLVEAISEEGGTAQQTAAQALATAMENISNSLRLIVEALEEHEDTANPHNANKGTFGLDKVANFAHTSATDSTSESLYLTAKAANTLRLEIEALASTVSTQDTTLTDAGTNITNLQTSLTSLNSALTNLTTNYTNLNTALTSYRNRTGATYYQVIYSNATGVGTLSNGNGGITQAFRSSLRDGIYTVSYSYYEGSTLKVSDCTTFTVTEGLVTAGNRSYYAGQNLTNAGRNPSITLKINGRSSFSFVTLRVSQGRSADLIGRVTRVTWTAL